MISCCCLVTESCPCHPLLPPSPLALSKGMRTLIPFSSIRISAWALLRRWEGGCGDMRPWNRQMVSSGLGFLLLLLQQITTYHYWLKATHLYYHIFLEVTSPRWIFRSWNQQGSFWRFQGRIAPFSFPDFRGRPHSLTCGAFVHLQSASLHHHISSLL